MNAAIVKSDRTGYHLLTNEGLRVGDKVFPLLHGYHTKGKFYLLAIETEDYLNHPEHVQAYTGFPSEPHTITEFFMNEGLQYIRTDAGYSPAEVYFKLEK